MSELCMDSFEILHIDLTCELHIVCAGIKAVATPESALELPLTAENVESVLDEIRPYLIADGGNVVLHEIDGNVVKLKLQGACGSCPSSVVTMKMGIERRLMEKIPEVVAVESIPDEETGLELNDENIEKVNVYFKCITLKHTLLLFFFFFFVKSSSVR